jgi:hypothetical protein
MKKYLIALTVLILSTNCFSQEENSTNLIAVPEESSTDWQVYYSNNQITIDYKFENCDPEMGYDQQQVILKVTNHTDSKLEISWHALLYFNDKCRTCDYEDEYTFYVGLAPNETKSGSCSVYSQDFQLKIFSKFTDANATNEKVLSSFDLSNIIIAEHLITE